MLSIEKWKILTDKELEEFHSIFLLLIYIYTYISVEEIGEWKNFGTRSEIVHIYKNYKIHTSRVAACAPIILRPEKASDSSSY